VSGTQIPSSLQYSALEPQVLLPGVQDWKHVPFTQR
jgi:hypothetical protein